MLHHVVNAVPLSFLFHDWAEGLALWNAIVSRIDAPIALVIMPDHVHLAHRRDVSREVGLGLQAWAQGVNRRRGTRGSRVARQPAPQWVPRSKRATVERYILLNPCRGELVADPLAWPLSTHRDAVGLAAAPVRRPVGDPDAYHRQVSADPTVNLVGTALPGPADRVPLHALRGAVCAALRVPAVAVERRGPARTLMLRAAIALACAPRAEIADRFGVHPRTLHRLSGQVDEDVLRVARLACDPRFGALASTHDLTLTPAWQDYYTRVMVPNARKLQWARRQRGQR